ncbi:hypothetical protein PR001_g23555 [Phytophthora rubi]|uniref:Uncharacterized protein n=1 Tax=Phytophthora rubi TaxID=129364 RepID=A0A6A3IH94_9STRA|nr:hypothetical protein PR002_g23977 [Phytophthora rubi]KAE8983070.1 hypothetical protein PR001_g23555 [Phytophthora rubi]
MEENDNVKQTSHPSHPVAHGFNGCIGSPTSPSSRLLKSSSSGDCHVNTQLCGNGSIVDDGVDMSVVHSLEHIGVDMHDVPRSSASMETDGMYMNAELCGNGSAEDDGMDMDAELYCNCIARRPYPCRCPYSGDEGVVAASSAGDAPGG